MEKYDFFIAPDKTHLDIKVKIPRLEASCTSEFKSILERTWLPSIKTVTVDCQTIDFIDSSGIGALLSIQKRMQGERAVTLKNTKPTVISVIELLRLHRVFNLHTN